MLYAIFFLLLIVFFPLLSLFLGIGIMAVFYAIGSFIVSWWWAICLLFAVIFIFKYGSGINREQEEGFRSSVDDGNLTENLLTYMGDPDLNNDAYIIYLTRKFSIQKSDVLGRYIVGDRLYSTLEEALEAGDRLYKKWSAQQVDENNITIQNLAIRKAYFQRFLIFCAVILAILFIYKSPVGHVSTKDIFGSEDKRPGIMAPALPLTALKNSEVSPAISPSFDCLKANSLPEKLICSDNELATEDTELFELYKKAKAKSDNPAAFKAEAAEAWKVRETNCRDKACLLEWYSNRKTYYAYILNK